MSFLLRIWIIAVSAIASTAAAAAPTVLRVNCGARDEGAEVYVNNEFKGECSVDIAAKPGVSVVRVVKKGALQEQVFEQTLRLAEGTVKKVDVMLETRLTQEGRAAEAKELADKQAEQVRRAEAEQAEQARLADVAALAKQRESVCHSECDGQKSPGARQCVKDTMVFGQLWHFSNYDKMDACIARAAEACFQSCKREN